MNVCMCARELAQSVDSLQPVCADLDSLILSRWGSLSFCQGMDVEEHLPWTGVRKGQCSVVPRTGHGSFVGTALARCL
jgi:hypothetical protein